MIDYGVDKYDREIIYIPTDFIVEFDNAEDDSNVYIQHTSNGNQIQVKASEWPLYAHGYFD